MCREFVPDYSQGHDAVLEAVLERTHRGRIVGLARGRAVVIEGLDDKYHLRHRIVIIRLLLWLYCGGKDSGHRNLEMGTTFIFGHFLW